MLAFIQDQCIRSSMRQFPVHRFAADELNTDPVPNSGAQPAFKGQAHHFCPRALVDLTVQRQPLSLRKLAFHVIEECIPAHSASVGSPCPARQCAVFFIPTYGQIL
ncbi:hypothetical protein [Arthrobacter sp. FX8]|uniref:hypothetical protein n=1 Tax=Arthrobacter sp. FX8 TaxID=2997335 RepID=UPI002DD66FA3|nr:hypothetical protein [Arthrobacter sp. FX8]